MTPSLQSHRLARVSPSPPSLRSDRLAPFGRSDASTPLRAIGLSTLFALGALGGCRRDRPAAPSAPHAGAAPVAPLPPETPRGALAAVVTFSGRVPLLGEQKRDTDPVCARTPMREDEVLVSNGRLKNVIVRVLGAPALPPPASPLVLDQSRCLYTPRVATATVGQVVEVRNSDPTFHNVHGYVGTSTLFNVPQVPSTPHLTKVFQEDGTLVRFRCDVHQWMTAVVWVQKNPFATVTDERGEARLGELPAGRFEVEAWHERYGAKRAPLVIEAGRTAEVSFDFTGKETAPAD